MTQFYRHRNHTYTNIQLTSLLVLRFLTGWHILYEGTAKALNPQWSSAVFLQESQWLLSGFAEWVVSNPGVLAIADFLNTWGLIAIGLGIITGLFFRIATITGSVLLFIYYLNSPPLVGMEYTVPSRGHNLIVDNNLIEAAALFILAVFPTSRIFGFDAFIIGTKTREQTGESI
jgi:thiosulfate dehydrogenase (quinone) large subunit